MPRRRARLAIAALLAHSLLIQAVAFLVRPAVSYAALDLGVPAPAVGAVGATFAIVPLVLAIGAGRLVDRFGERIVMLGGALTATASCAVLAAAGDSLAGILTGTALLGAGHLGCIVGQQAVVARTATAGRLDSMFGYYTFAASLGQAIGPALLGLGGSTVEPDTGRLFVIAVGIAGALVPATALIARGEPAAAAVTARRTSTWQLLRTPGVARAIATSAIVVAAVDLTTVYVPALGAEIGLTATEVGTILAVRAGASMASRALLGVSARALGRGRLMVSSIVVSAIGLAALAVPMPLWALLVVAALLGLGLGIGQPLTMSWLVEQSPHGQRGSALALRLSGNRLGQLTIPALAGAAAGAGAGASLVAIGVLVAASLLLVRGLRLDGDD